VARRGLPDGTDDTDDTDGTGNLGEMGEMGGTRRIALTTYEPSGAAPAVGVRVHPLGEGRLAIVVRARSQEVERVRSDPRVRLQACGRRGALTPGSHAYDGTAQVLLSGGLFEEARGRSRRSGGLITRLGALTTPLRRGDAVPAVLLVRLVRLDELPQPNSD